MGGGGDEIYINKEQILNWQKNLKLMSFFYCSLNDVIVSVFFMWVRTMRNNQ